MARSAVQTIGTLTAFLALLLIDLSLATAQESISVHSNTELASEESIQRGLDERISVEFAETPLSDVVAYLSGKVDIPFQLDTKSLEDASIGPDTPVTRSVKGVTLRSALRLMLEAMDLTYTIKNEVLLITTPETASNELTTKVYLVNDLVTHRTSDGLKQNFSQLIEVISTTIAPSTWDKTGGPGSIQEFRNSGSIVISQTNNVHDQIAILLAALRKARDKQGVEPTVLEPKKTSHPSTDKRAGQQIALNRVRIRPKTSPRQRLLNRRAACPMQGDLEAS